MSKTLEQILGAKNLIGLIQGQTQGVPSDVLPPAFMPGGGNTAPVVGATGTYTKVTGTRKTARLVHYGSPSKKRELAGISDVSVTLMHTFEQAQIKPVDLINLLNEDSQERQRMGAQTVARQVADFKQLFTNLRISSVFSMFCLGAIYYDGDGNLLPNATGAVVTVPFQIPAVNQGNCSGLVGASWATAATDIPSHIRALKARARQLTGYPLKYAFYGQNVPSYFDGNTIMQRYLAASPRLAEQHAAAEMPDYFGLKWVPIYEQFYNAATGTVGGIAVTDSDQPWSPVDQVIFTPDPSPDWFEWLEGTYPIPTQLTISGDASAALASLSEVQGMFSYAAMNVDPPGVTMYGGDTFLPVLKVPAAIFQADVVF